MGGEAGSGRDELRLRDTVADRCRRSPGPATDTENRRRTPGSAADGGGGNGDVMCRVTTDVVSEGFMPSVICLSLATDLRNVSARNYPTYMYTYRRHY